MLIPGYAPLGSLTKPLCGLVLHYGNGGPNGLPSEAAYIGIPQSKGIQTPKVDVYVPKSSIITRTRAYAPLGANVTVSPLLFDETELDTEAFLTMMAVDSLENAPLYMQIVVVCLALHVSYMSTKSVPSPFFATWAKVSASPSF